MKNLFTKIKSCVKDLWNVCDNIAGNLMEAKYAWIWIPLIFLPFGLLLIMVAFLAF